MALETIIYGYTQRKRIKQIIAALAIILFAFALAIYLLMVTVMTVIQGAGKVTDSNSNATAFNEFQNFSYKTISGSTWYTFNHPYTFPTLGVLTEGVILNDAVQHTAWNISGGAGTEVHAFANGTVTTVTDNILHQTTKRWQFCDTDPSGVCWSDGNTPADVQIGCGNEVDVLHTDGVATQYCHLQSLPKFKSGDPVTEGQLLGTQGSTGFAKSVYLYFELSKNGQAIDPSYAFSQTRFKNWGQ